jgi:predicted acetyltransferase
MTMQTTLLPAAATHQPALANLIQLYQYDRSECDGADVDEQGRFNTLQIDPCWTGADCLRFLIQANSQLAGFVFAKHSQLPYSHAEGHMVADFFILRRFRRQGVGRAAATALFDRLPGPWEIASCAQNVPAHVFWRSVIDRYTAGRYIETWLHTADWRGTVHSFASPAPA